MSIPTIDQIMRTISGGSGKWPELEDAAHRVLNIFGELIVNSKSSRSPAGYVSDYEDKYHNVMELLKQTKMKHGLCKPRERRACTHCNALDDLDKLISEYKGRKIYLQET